VSEKPLFRLLCMLILALGLTRVAGADAEKPLLDPTRPSGWQVSASESPSTVNKPVGALKLQGTFSRSGRRSAVISGRRVVVGDEVSGAKVVEIRRNRVTLRIDGENVELASLAADVKSPANRKGDRK